MVDYLAVFGLAVGQGASVLGFFYFNRDTSKRLDYHAGVLSTLARKTSEVALSTQCTFTAIGVTEEQRAEAFRLAEIELEFHKLTHDCGEED